MRAFDTAGLSFDGARHDHYACVADAVKAAESACRRRGSRLTPLRRRVLELVWSGHRPVGAYEVLEHLSAEQGRVAPPTVYRALDFLREHGLVHRIESLNAYIGCARPAETHAGQFLICRTCGTTAEVHDPGIEAALRQRAGALGFAVERETVELRGVCPGCRESGAGGDAG